MVNTATYTNLTRCLFYDNQGFSKNSFVFAIITKAICKIGGPFHFVDDYSKIIINSIFFYLQINTTMIVQQLICDVCNRILLEKQGENHLDHGKFPITEQEAMAIDKEHRGHQCHIDVVEKD